MRHNLLPAVKPGVCQTLQRRQGSVAGGTPRCTEPGQVPALAGASRDRYMGRDRPRPSKLPEPPS